MSGNIGSLKAGYVKLQVQRFSTSEQNQPHLTFVQQQLQQQQQKQQQQRSTVPQRRKSEPSKRVKEVEASKVPEAFTANSITQIRHCTVFSLVNLIGGVYIYN